MNVADEDRGAAGGALFAVDLGELVNASPPNALLRSPKALVAGERAGDAAVVVGCEFGSLGFAVGAYNDRMLLFNLERLVAARLPSEADISLRVMPGESKSSPSNELGAVETEFP